MIQPPMNIEIYIHKIRFIWLQKQFSFFRQRHALLTSLDIFAVTYTVTNFLPKLEKTEFPFFDFPIFGYCLIL